jgi:hypothetical protein
MFKFAYIGYFLKFIKKGLCGVHVVTSFGVIQRRPCKGFPTGTLFGRVPAVTSATMDLVAKSLRGPWEVHFLQKIKGHVCFPAG